MSSVIRSAANQLIPLKANNKVHRHSLVPSSSSSCWPSLIAGVRWIYLLTATASPKLLYKKQLSNMEERATKLKYRFLREDRRKQRQWND